MLYFSVVVPTYNRKSMLRQTLAELLAQDYPDFEIIIVDDGSMDATSEMIMAEFPSIRYIRQENKGPAAARNRGIAIATGDIIAFTDDDCLPPHDWLAKLTDGYARYPQVAGVGGCLQAPEDVLRQQILARYEMFIARSVYHVNENEYLGSFECPAGGTNNMSYRRAILNSVEGFDEAFPFAAGEDADLKWRICARGNQLLYLPLKMTHLHPYTWASFKRQSYIRGKGALFFQAKHVGKPNCARTILRLVRRWLSVPRDWFGSESRPYAMIRFFEAWYNFRGEWNLLRNKSEWTFLT